MINPLLLCDFYKIGHVVQYPIDVTQVWSNWTPRSSRVPGQNTVVHFGLQYFIEEYLERRFTHDFFGQSLSSVLRSYRDVVKTCLGVENPKTDHIEWLHDLGHLPIEIWSIPEGFSTPLNVPSMVITNTLPEAFWLPNYLETMLSMVLWKPSTSATTAQRLRKIGLKWAKAAGETDFGFVDWQFHDFSMRGMSGLEDAILSGMGHLLSFSGTDSIPAILAAREYYDADLTVGSSVSATEHSVMCAGGCDNELETFRHLIEDVYPSGIVSIVSDTWDLWRVLTEYVPALKGKILARDGKIVIRPDSGDPVSIMLGDLAWRSVKQHDYATLDRFHPACTGVLGLLAQVLGVTNGMINKAGAIYGDSINEERADAILRGCVEDLKLSPYNMVFGVGSFSYEYRTRDTYGFAMKATAVRRGGDIVPIFKCPVTDDPLTPKKSHRGLLAVYQTDKSRDEQPEYYVYEESMEHQLANCEFRKVYSDGHLLIRDTFDQIRKRVRA